MPEYVTLLFQNHGLLILGEISSSVFCASIFVGYKSICNQLQPPKAPKPIYVTLDGILNVPVSLSLLLNAFIPI